METSKIVAICQPNFLPWLGYFEMGHRADIYVMFDDVQYIRREWVNRNKVFSASSQGWQWLTVPLKNTARDTLIKDVEINNETDWSSRMLDTLRHVYGKAPYYKTYSAPLAELLSKKWENLSAMNVALIRLIYKMLGIKDNIAVSSDLDVGLKKDDKLAGICESLGAGVYLANNGSKSYIEPAKFFKKGIGFVFQDYTHPSYAVKGREFVPYLSAVDLLFWHGSASLDMMLQGRKEGWKNEIVYKDMSTNREGVAR